jgi:hypothetical protein
MKELNISEKIKNRITDFLQRLKDTYGDELISIVLYGSASSGEYVDKHSNLNFLIVLKNTDCQTLKRASGIVDKFPLFRCLFMTESYINSSTDIFPIEFLDLKENNHILYGKDVLSGIQIDTKNLRFQCEQELKGKLLNLRNIYLKMGRNKTALRSLLFQSITSILHIARNLLRLKGRSATYKKEGLIKELGAELHIDAKLWEKILAAKNKTIKLNNREIEPLFLDFVKEVEKITDIIDRL